MHPLELSPAHLTRPPRSLLTTWDIRIRRYTSPSYPGIVTACISPPALTPPRRSDHQEQATQTQPHSRVHRGTQHHSSAIQEQSTQSSDSDWEKTTRTAATQTEATPTPPKASKAKRRNSTKPATPRLNWTHTRPSISWQEKSCH